MSSEFKLDEVIRATLNGTVEHMYGYGYKETASKPEGGNWKIEFEKVERKSKYVMKTSSVTIMLHVDTMRLTIDHDKSYRMETYPEFKGAIGDPNIDADVYNHLVSMGAFARI